MVAFKDWRFCGYINYNDTYFKVHWDTNTDHVYISKVFSKTFKGLTLKDSVAKTIEEVPKIALNILNAAFGV